MCGKYHNYIFFHGRPDIFYLMFYGLDENTMSAIRIEMNFPVPTFLFKFLSNTAAKEGLDQELTDSVLENTIKIFPSTYQSCGLAFLEV